MILMAKMPLISAVINAMEVGRISSCKVSFADINSYTKDAMIIGIDIRKENSAAVSRLVPVSNMVEMVVPLRDKPGITAMP